MEREIDILIQYGEADINKKLHLFLQFPDLRDPSKMSSWIFRIAYHLCQDHFRQLKAAQRNESIDEEKIENLEDVFAQEELVQKDLEQREMGQCVQNQIDLLPQSLRAVLVLFDLMELNHQEIAETLGITIENVKVRLHRARKKLKTILEEKCTFEKDERNVLVCNPVDCGSKEPKGNKKILRFKDVVL